MVSWMSCISDSLRSRRHIACSFIVAGVILLTTLAAYFPATFAQTGFTVNGKSVTASTYQAYKLMNESIHLMRQNRTIEAVKQLKRAIQLDPSVPEVRSMLGMALARLGKTDEATEQMRMAIASSSDQKALTAHLNLAALYQSGGKTEDALQIYKKVLAEFPNSKVTHTVQDRVRLLEKEMKRQHLTRHQKQESLSDDKSYFGNVIGQGRKRWPASSMPIRVYIYSGEGLDGYHDQYDQILRKAFSEWETASKGKVKFALLNSPHDADITCTWIDNPKLLESSAEGGEAEVQTFLESVVKSRIMLSLNDGGAAFPFTDNLVRSLCLHEIGHSLGLVGHSTRADDVMYCSTPLVDREEHLSARDIATLGSVYATDVDPTSQFLATIDRETHGNTVNVLRLGIIAVIAVIACIGVLLAVLRRSKKRKVARRKA